MAQQVFLMTPKTSPTLGDSKSVIPTANSVYTEGREAYHNGTLRRENPYLTCWAEELDYTWTSADVWTLGWDAEQEKDEQARSTRR